MAQPCDRDLKEKFLSFVCLFIYFCHPLFSFYSFYFFWRLSAFFHPHFPIRIRHPQVSGPRFTDTPVISYAMDIYDVPEKTDRSISEKTTVKPVLSGHPRGVL